MLKNVDQLLDEKKSHDEKFELTAEEMRDFEKAFQKQEFRDMFMEYVKEISDPEARKEYEREIAQLERERGNNIRWVRPEPRFCLQTERNASIPKNLKSSSQQINTNIVLVNIAASTEIDKPKQQIKQKGTAWTLPHTLSPPRLDSVDKQHDLIGIIFDVVYHPEATDNPILKQSIIDAATSSIETHFGTKLDASKIQEIPGIKYHGTRINTAIKEPIISQDKDSAETKSSKKEEDSQLEEKNQFLQGLIKRAAEPVPISITEPHHVIVYQYPFDMGDHITRDLVDIHHGSRRKLPCALTVRIDLPRVRQISNVDVKVELQQIYINVPDMYHGVIKLPYSVDSEATNAKWYADKKQLELKCPLLVQSTV